jgi:hypothetical protein
MSAPIRANAWGTRADIGLLFPGIKWAVGLMGWTVDPAGWQTALMAMGAVVVVRLILAPYWHYRDLHNKWAGPASGLARRAVEAQEAHNEELRLGREQRDRENDPKVMIKRAHDARWAKRFAGVPEQPAIREFPAEPKPPIAPITYDIPMWEAVQHVAKALGDRDAGKFWPEARRGIRQKANDGALTVWGRKQLARGDKVYSDVMTKIPKEYWELSQITAPAVSQDSFDITHDGWQHTAPEFFDAWGAGGYQERNAYTALHLNRQEMKKQWPSD